MAFYVARLFLPLLNPDKESRKLFKFRLPT